jgi:hypothetical protein
VRLKEGSQHAPVQAGHANDGSQTADGKNQQGKKNPRLQFRDPEAVPESFGNSSKHGA